MPATTSNIEKTPCRNVLIIRFSALGDVAMTIPVVYEVCRAYPDCRFTLLTKKSVVGVFVCPPENLQIFSADTKGRHKGLRGIWRLFRELRRLHFDAVADLHNVLRSKALDRLFGLSGIRREMLEKGRKEKRKLVARKKQLPLRPLKTSFRRYAEVFEQLGFSVPDTFRSVFDATHRPCPLPDTIPERQAGELWVGVAPFAKHRGKIYPPDRSEAVVKALSQRGGCRIFLMGGGGEEAAVAEQWAARYPAVVSLAGKRLGFPTELSLMSRMSVVFSMDSANMHLASLAGIPVVSVWGQTHPYAGFLGWRQSEANVVQDETLSCRPCSVFGNKPCYRGDYACMNLPEKEILSRIEKFLLNEKV